MARRIAIIVLLLFIPDVSRAQFIDAGFGSGPFGQRQFTNGLFGTGGVINNSGGGGGVGSLMDDSNNLVLDDSSNQVTG